MSEILTILIAVFDLVTVALGAARYWRMACGFLVAASAAVLLGLFFSSPGIRWIVGFHVFVILFTGGIVWEQKCGKLNE